MNFVTMLWRGIRQSYEQPAPALPRRGGGRRKKPTPAPTGDTVPRQWHPPTKGTAPADRKRIRRRTARAALRTKRMA